MIHGEQKEAESDMVDGRYSPPPPNSTNPHCFTMDIGMPVVPSNLPKEKPPINVVGDVGGRIAIMVVGVFILQYPPGKVELLSIYFILGRLN